MKSRAAFRVGLGNALCQALSQRDLVKVAAAIRPEMLGTNLCYGMFFTKHWNSKSIPIQTSSRLLLYHTVLCDDHEFASVFASAFSMAP